MDIKRGKRKNNELELPFLALDNLEQGIMVCDENFKPLIHNAPMLIYLRKFRNNKGKRGLKLPKEFAGKLKEYKRGLSIGGLERQVFRLVLKGREFFLTIKGLLYRSQLYFLLILNEKRIREGDIWMELRNKYRITEREFEIIKMVRQGFSNRDISEELKLSSATIKTHLRNIYKKTSSSNRAELIGFIDDLMEA